jgi:phosphoglycerate-specific signal transduction histidine kinase
VVSAEELIRELPMSILLKLIHELNQPLTVIKAYVGGCILRIKKNELSSEQMINVMQKINENAELFEHKIYSMQQIIIQEEDSDIPSIITEMASLFTYEIKNNDIKLVLDFHDTLADFRMDKSLLKQILFRLFKQCIGAIEVEKTLNAELTVQTQLDKENALNLTLKSNAPIKDKTELDHAITYCRSLIIKDSGALSVEFQPNEMCCTFRVFNQED